MNIEIGKDVALIGFDDIDFLYPDHPPRFRLFVSRPPNSVECRHDCCFNEWRLFLIEYKNGSSDVAGHSRILRM